MGADRTNPKTQTMNANTIQLIRHTYDCFEVVAFDLMGRKVGHRMYSHGRNRKTWAIRQAELWSEKFYIPFDVRFDFYC